MLRVLIVDDEPWAREELRMLLSERDDVEIVGEADCVQATVAQLQHTRPDVTFLDIKLRNESAFDVFKHGAVGSHVVFLTAHEEHALRAFEVNVLDYLVKPLEPRHLDRALARVPARPHTLSTSTPDASENSRVYLKEANNVRACEVSSIAYVQSAAVYTEVHLTSG